MVGSVLITLSLATLSAIQFSTSVEHLWNLKWCRFTTRRGRACCNGNIWSQKGLPGELPAVVWILTEMCHSGMWCIVTETPRDRYVQTGKSSMYLPYTRRSHFKQFLLAWFPFNVTWKLTWLFKIMLQFSDGIQFGIDNPSPHISSVGG